MRQPLFILHRAILVILIVRYARKVKLAFTVSTISRWRINASGGSQTRKEEGASHPARHGKNAEAFLNMRYACKVMLAFIVSTISRWRIKPQLQNAPLEHCYACLGTADCSRAKRKVLRILRGAARTLRRSWIYSNKERWMVKRITALELKKPSGAACEDKAFPDWVDRLEIGTKYINIWIHCHDQRTWNLPGECFAER